MQAFTQPIARARHSTPAATSAVTRAALLGAIFLLAIAPACKGKEGKESRAAVGAILDLATADASRCLPCHQSIVDEWTQAMHAQSTAERNPLYAMMVAKATEKVGEGAPKKCGTCHAPSGLGTSPRERDGVTCLTCHELKADHPGQLSGIRPPQSFARPSAGNTDSNALCLSCHGEFKSPDGFDVCTTGAEHAEHTAATTAAGAPQNCVDCHMPTAAGPSVFRGGKKDHRSHRFPAARAGLLAGQAAVLAATRDATTNEIVVEIKPGSIGHALPTGNPMRFVVATVEAKDAEGKVLWRNHGDDLPPFDAGEALLMRIFSDADGNRPVPPFAAAGESEDRRLQPGQVRSLRYPIPPNTAKVDVSLTYHLGPAKTLKAAGVDSMWQQPIPLGNLTIDWTVAK